MGLLIVLLDVSVNGYDMVPDALGWVLVFTGVLQLRAALDNAGTLLALAALAGAVSVALFFPAVLDAVPASGQWLLSLPEVAFSIVLCGSVARLVEHDEPTVASRMRGLRWFFVALAFAPALVYGGRVAALVLPIAVVAVAANVYLVYLVFKVSRKEYALA